MPLGEARDGISRSAAGRLDPIALGLAVRDVRAEGLGGVARRHRLRRVLHLLQLLPRRLRAAPGGAVLQAGRRAARPRGRPAARRRLLDASRPPPVRRRRRWCSRSPAASSASSARSATAQLMMTGLRTWWVDAVGTTALTLHVSPISLAAGALGGIARRRRVHLVDAARARAESPSEACWPVRSESRTARESQLKMTERCGSPALQIGARRLCCAGCGRAASGPRFGGDGLPAAGAFFGAGALLLAACLAGAGAAGCGDRRARRSPGAAGGRSSRLGLRNATYRPGRSVLSIAVVAAATFILISVDAFRRDGTIDWSIRRSGTGGYALIVETCCRSPTIPTAPTAASCSASTIAADVAIDAVPPAARRRCELSEPVRAAAAADPRRQRASSSPRAASRFRARSIGRRGARQPMAAARAASIGRWRRSR